MTGADDGYEGGACSKENPSLAATFNAPSAIQPGRASGPSPDSSKPAVTDLDALAIALEFKRGQHALCCPGATLDQVKASVSAADLAGGQAVLDLLRRESKP